MDIIIYFTDVHWHSREKVLESVVNFKIWKFATSKEKYFEKYLH